MKYEDMDHTVPQHGMLGKLRVFLIKGEVYECDFYKNTERFPLRNLKTGKLSYMTPSDVIAMGKQIRDITAAYLKETPGYAMKRMEKAQDYLDHATNYSEASFLLAPLAVNGDPNAQYLLAYCYYKAPHHLQQPEYVNTYLEKAASQNHLKAQYLLAQNYRTGFNNTKDLVLSAKWYEKAAKQGHAEAAAITGKNFEKGVEGLYAPDPTAAFHWYQISAEANDPLGIYYLGLAYENGIGTAVNRIKALEYYRKGAEKKHKECTFRYAYLQDPIYGFKETANEEAAMKWYYEAEYLGAEQAFRYRGYHYYNGTCGVDINHQKAQESFVRGADLGDIPCAVAAGSAYLYGKYVVKDFNKAFRLCSQAAEAGNTKGMLLLAHYYLLLPVTKENTKKALEWAQKAQRKNESDTVLLEEAQSRLDEFQKQEKKKKGFFGRRKK